MDSKWFEKEEYVTGALVGGAFTLFLGWLAVVSVILCAVFWRLGGIEGGNKLFRRVGVPLTLSCLLVSVDSLNWFDACFTMLAGFFTLSLGYGIPDSSTGDEGSRIGRFWFLVFGKEKDASVATRGTIGLLLGLSFLPLTASNLLFWYVGAVILFIGLPLIEEVVE